MKKIKNIFLVGLLIVAAVFAACSSNDDPAVATPPSFELMGVGTYDLAELDEKEFVVVPIEFSSSVAWHLSSDKLWVLFSPTENGTYYCDIMGEAGTHKVYMKITNDARTFDSSSANVRFAYGDSEYALDAICRDAKKHDITVLDDAGNEMESIGIDASASMQVAISANYSFGIKSYPDWIEEPGFYNGYYMLNVKDEYTPFEQSGNIVVVSEDGLVEQLLPVTYPGMAPDRMILTSEHGQWGWNVSLDGKIFKKSTENTDGESQEYLIEESLPFGIKCYNYDCKLVFVNVAKSGKISTPSNPWLLAKQDEADKSVVTLEATPFTPTKAQRTRKGFVFAVPSAAYSDFQDTLAVTKDTLFVDKFVNYVLAEVTQRDIFAADTFAVTTSKGEYVPHVKETSGDVYEWISSDLNVEDVYSFEADYGASYTITTPYLEDDWSGSFFIFDRSGHKYVNEVDWNVRCKVNKDGYYYLTLTALPEKYFDETVILRLHDNNVNKAAILINPHKK